MSVSVDRPGPGHGGAAATPDADGAAGPAGHRWTDAPVAERVDRALDDVGLADLLDLGAFAHVDRETVSTAVAEFARFAAEVIAPTNVDGDRIGNTLDPETGRVHSPASFARAYEQFVEAGWQSVPVATEHGGAGLPRTVGVALQELFAAANVGLSLCPGLTQSAIEVLAVRGSESQQTRYLPHLVTGEWNGTMLITEPDAGSDVGAIRTAATLRSDGRWVLNGTKIFISWGDHDLTDNVVHFVLARTPGSAPGTKGLSLFIVPARLLDDSGEAAERNGIKAIALEHKVGLHASPTCVMELDGAVGELLGDEGAGMRAMFTMMNPARLAIGLQGLGIGEAAYRQARAFAAERGQGRTPGAPAGIVAHIDQHPDVRRMLALMASAVDAMRLVIYTTAHHSDVAAAHPDPDERARAQDLADLYTPIAKAWTTDMGVEVASLGIQVHGGMGYMEDSGVPQRWRDARISPIYEGTNGIQAIDLVTRKITRHDGALVSGLFDQMDETAGLLVESGPLQRFLADAVESLRTATHWLIAAVGDASEDALAGATVYLAALGDLVAGWLLARRAVDHAEADLADADEMMAVATFWATERLATIPGRAITVTSGAHRLYL